MFTGTDVNMLDTLVAMEASGLSVGLGRHGDAGHQRAVGDAAVVGEVAAEGAGAHRQHDVVDGAVDGLAGGLDVGQRQRREGEDAVAASGRR